MELNELHEGVSGSLWNDQTLEKRDSNRGCRLPRIQLSSKDLRPRAGWEAWLPLVTMLPETSSSIFRRPRGTSTMLRTGFEHISNILRDPHLDEIAALIGNLRSKEPTAIVAGIVLVSLECYGF